MVISVLFEETPTQASSFLNSIGLESISHTVEDGTTALAIEQAKIDMDELIGKVCSYFTYQACPAASCSLEQEVIYVVLTETKKLSASQFEKITELSGGEEMNERVVSERNEAQEVRLAMQDQSLCEPEHDSHMETFIAQTVEIAESKKP